MKRDDITTESIQLANTNDLTDCVKQTDLASVAFSGSYNDLLNLPEEPRPNHTQLMKHIVEFPESDLGHVIELDTEHQIYDVTLTGSIDKLVVQLPDNLDNDHVYNAELWLLVTEAEIENNELLDDSKWTWVGQKPSFNNQTDCRYFISLRTWGSGNDGRSGIRLISCWRCDEL